MKAFVGFILYSVYNKKGKHPNFSLKKIEEKPRFSKDERNVSRFLKNKKQY